MNKKNEIIKQIKSLKVTFDKWALLVALDEIKKFIKRQQYVYFKFENDKVHFIGEHGKDFIVTTFNFDIKEITRGIDFLDDAERAAYLGANKDQYFKINLKVLAYYINEWYADYATLWFDFIGSNKRLVLWINDAYFMPVYIDSGKEILLNKRLNYAINHPNNGVWQSNISRVYYHINVLKNGGY